MIEGPAQLTPGAAGSFKAFLVNAADQSRRDVTSEVQWSSSNPGVLTIQNGSAQGLTPGQTTLEVRFEGVRATRVVSISSIEGLPAATLVIESLSIDVHGPDSGGNFGYGVRFLLRETGSESSATIGDVMVIGPNQSDGTGPGCWRDPLRVPAGGTLDVFATDTGLRWLSYCAPGSGGRTQTPALRLIVSFTDEKGRLGTIEAVVGRTP